MNSAHRDLSKNEIFGVYIHMVYIYITKKYVYSAKFVIFGRILQQTMLTNLYLIFQYKNIKLLMFSIMHQTRLDD